MIGDRLQTTLPAGVGAKLDALVRLSGLNKRFVLGQLIAAAHDGTPMPHYVKLHASQAPLPQHGGNLTPVKSKPGPKPQFPQVPMNGWPPILFYPSDDDEHTDYYVWVCHDVLVYYKPVKRGHWVRADVIHNAAGEPVGLRPRVNDYAGAASFSDSQRWAAMKLTSDQHNYINAKRQSGEAAGFHELADALEHATHENRRERWIPEGQVEQVEPIIASEDELAQQSARMLAGDDLTPVK